MKYALIGNGIWSAKIKSALTEMGREVFQIPIKTRMNHMESKIAYLNRLLDAISCTKCNILWICIPPGLESELAITAALNCGKNVICEKPWMAGKAVTLQLSSLAEGQKLRVAVNYQYCFHDELSKLSAVAANSDCYWGGEFSIDRPNRLGIDAAHNLASHLFAIAQLYFPNVQLKELVTGYGVTNKRSIKIFDSDTAECLENVDLLFKRQPLLERFVYAFENAIECKKDFILNFEFALKVQEAVIEAKEKGKISNSLL